MDCRPPGSSVHGFLQARTLERAVAMPSSGELPDPGTQPVSPAPSALADGFFIAEPRGKPQVLYIFLRSCYLHKLEWWSSTECVSLWGMNVFCKKENPQEAAKATSFLESHPVLPCGPPAHEYWCDCNTQAHISLQTVTGGRTNHCCEETVMKRHSLVKRWDWMKWKSKGRQQLCQARFVSFCQWLVVRARGAPFRWTDSPSSLHAQSSDHRPVRAAKSLRGRGKLVGRGAGKDALFAPAALCADMPATYPDEKESAPHAGNPAPAQALGREDPPGGGRSSPCSIPARELHGQRQQSIGSQRVGHHWALTLPLSTPSSFPTPAPGNYTQLPGQLPREGDSSCSGPELPSSFTTGHSYRRSWPLYRHLSDQGGVCYGQRWQQRRHLRRAQTAGRPQGTACFLSWNLFMWPSRGCAARRRSCVPHRECIWMHVPNYLTVNILKEKN